MVDSKDNGKEYEYYHEYDQEFEKQRKRKRSLQTLSQGVLLALFFSCIVVTIGAISFGSIGNPVVMMVVGIAVVLALILGLQLLAKL